MNRGKTLIAGIVLVALVAATVAWWYQFRQGQRVLDLWGAETAYLMRLAKDCELEWLQPVSSVSSAGEPRAAHPIPLQDRPGFVHARQALIHDATYDWETTHQLQAGPLPPENAEWEFAIHFRQGDQKARLLFDLENHLMYAPDQKRIAAIIISKGLRVFVDEVGESIDPDR